MKSSKKRKARRRRMLFLMTVLLGATAGAYAVCAQQYTAKFIPGTVVNGVNISDQTAEEVERDTVLIMIDGVLTEVTGDDPEAER